MELTFYLHHMMSTAERASPPGRGGQSRSSSRVGCSGDRSTGLVCDVRTGGCYLGDMFVYWPILIPPTGAERTCAHASCLYDHGRASDEHLGHATGACDELERAGGEGFLSSSFVFAAMETILVDLSWSYGAQLCLDTMFAICCSLFSCSALPKDALRIPGGGDVRV